MRISSTEFQQNVGRYQDAAQQAPVVITKHDRPHSVLVSGALFEVFTKGRVARLVEDLDDDTLKGIAGASVLDTYAALDRIIKDWTPCAFRLRFQALRFLIPIRGRGSTAKERKKVVKTGRARLSPRDRSLKGTRS